MSHVSYLVAALLPFLGQLPDKVDALKTVAERSDYRATARYDEVAAWCQAFAKTTPLAHLTELGRSSEGRSIPLLIVADPPVKSAAQAARSGKLVCFVIGNIHAGEVCGKEALPMLLREICSSPHPALLKDVILAVAPIYNTDGNERVSKTNRPGQVGPEEGMGQRANARGLDLNRDFIKLEAPETRGLVRFLERVESSSLHRHAHDQRIVSSLHDHLRRPEEPGRRSGGHRLHAQDVFPRGRRGVREANGLESVLLREFQSRPHAVDDLSGRGPIRHDLCRTAKSALRPLRGVFLRPVQDARAGHPRLRARVPGNRGQAQGRDRQAARRCSRSGPRVPAQASPGQSRWPGRDPVQGACRRESRRRSSAMSRPRKTAAARRPTRPRTTRVKLMNEFEPAESVARPFAYLVPAGFRASGRRRSSGTASTSRSCARTSSSTSRSTGSTRSSARRGGSRAIKLVELTVTPRREVADGPGRDARGPHGPAAREPGGLSARAALGRRPGHLEFLRRRVEGGGDFPVVRLPQPAPISFGPAEPLAEDRGPIRPITFDQGGGMRGAAADSAAFSAAKSGSTASTGCKSATGGS